MIFQEEDGELKCWSCERPYSQWSEFGRRDGNQPKNKMLTGLRQQQAPGTELKRELYRLQVKVGVNKIGEADVRSVGFPQGGMY